MASDARPHPTAFLGRALTARALVVGLVAVAATVFIVAWAELVTGTIQIGFLQLPPVVVALLFALALLNKLLARLCPRLALTTPELVVVYCMMLMASMVTSRGLMEDLVPMQVGLNYYATPANKWEETYFGLLKPWMVPWDTRGGPVQDLAAGFYEGLKPGVALPWRPWIIPTLSWLTLILLTYAAFLAMSAFLQHLWADHELLSFPLVQLPLEMISGEGSHEFVRDRMMWLGFSVPLVLFGLNGLHQIYPQVPQLPVSVNLNQYMTGRPWSDLGYLTMFFSVAATGFFYLLPGEVLFSLWAFFLLARAQEIVASSFGANPLASPHAGVKLFVGYQTAGAYFGLVGYMAYTSWPRLKVMLARARTASGIGHQTCQDPRSRHAPAEQPLLPYRTALVVLGLAFGGILVFCGAAGMSAWVAVVEFGIYLFVQAVVMARSTAEAGMPMTEGSFTPFDVLGAFMNKRAVGPRNLVALAFTNCFFSRDLRGMVLTGFLDGQKMADQTRLTRRSLLSVFIVALVISILLAGAIHLYLPYQRGAVTMYYYVYQSIPTQFWNEHFPLMTGQDSFTWQAPFWMAVGIIATIALSLLRRAFVWWPLGGLGYALSASWTTTVFWFPMLVAWVIKWVIMRYGGIGAYRKARPIFLGLIFGEFTMAVFWTLVSCICRTPAPFFPWP